MKNKAFLAALALPVAFGGYVALHPGVAFAGSSLAALAASPMVEQGTYKTDGAHTSIGFEIGHLGIAKVQGRFTKHNGEVKLDAKDLTKSSVRFTVDTASVDTAVAPRDAHLRTADFFEVDKYPTMSFESTKIRKSGNRYVADGNLTIKGVTKKVSIGFKHVGPITDPWGNQRIGVVADPFNINRQDYGIAYDAKLPNGTPSVANDVTVRVSLEAVLAKPE